MSPGFLGYKKVAPKPKSLKSKQGRESDDRVGKGRDIVRACAVQCADKVVIRFHCHSQSTPENKGLQVFQRIDASGESAESLGRMRDVLKKEKKGTVNKPPTKTIGNTWNDRKWCDVDDSSDDRWY